PFMPGQTQYMDTPVIPTQAFADGYNLPDSEYPDLTPAVSTVTGTASGGGAGPWVSAAGQALTIRCLGYDTTANPCTKVVPNPAATWGEWCYCHHRPGRLSLRPAGHHHRERQALDRRDHGHRGR